MTHVIKIHTDIIESILNNNTMWFKYFNIDMVVYFKLHTLKIKESTEDTKVDFVWQDNICLVKYIIFNKNKSKEKQTSVQ